jgi:hypothetical protein
MKALFKEDNKADIRFWGVLMQKRDGVIMVKHYREN